MATTLADNAPARPEAAAQAPKSLPAAKIRTAAERPAKPAHETKQSLVIAMLRRQEGASVNEMVAATDWAPHSCRGFMSGALKKRLGLVVVSEKDAGGERRYYIAASKPSEG